MYNKNQKRLGISSEVYKVVHKIALIAIFHSTLIAPSQNLMHEYYKIKTAKVNKGYAGNNLLNFNNYDDLFDNSSNVENKQPNVISQKQIVLKEKSYGFSSRYFYSDIKIGSIGKSSKVNFDDPSDNLFNFNFDKKQLANTTVFLKYNVYGIDPKSMPSKSINSTYVTGGYAFKESNQWNEVVEEIDSEWLINGRNSIFFSIPENAEYTYKIKDVTLFTAPTKLDKNEIILNNEGIFIKKDEKLYVNGFFKKSKTEGSEIKIFANNQELKVFDNKFENFIDFKDEKFIDLKVFQNGILIAKDLVSIDKVVEADKLYAIENKFVKNSKYIYAFSKSTLEVEGAKLSVLESSMVESKEISVSMLRAIDIAPLESGFINVTKDKKAFRFLPDGTKFAKPVKIEIEYDEKLIPMGYTPKDIKTFYFDIQHKKWLEVAKDSVDQINKKVVSSTTHFTDYINGIIQTPESPQTSAFTPTMMNDIKAASPESQIALISPPEVSQKGAANVSYPIKLPAGRNGMQPQVAIQYSSDGGNGWLGEGWGISTPAITLDTRWGVPVFDPTNESEIYNLNGEQLMYPKVKNGIGDLVDWMPNRHFDATDGIYSTQEVERITDAKFTFRKQGDFSKIERKGSDPSDYYWKVTSTDGTISWYGGKDAVVNNAVIKNDQGKIVQWSLYMVEDVYTNNIKYNYTSQILPTQYGVNVNLNQGLVYNLSNIVYTGFANGAGNYRVEFYNEATVIRPDISINSRLGLKQITPFRLDRINVLYNNSAIRSYKLEYTTGKFGKSLLSKVIENDAAGKNFYEHTFEYYDDIAANNNTLFGEKIRVAMPKPNTNYLLGFGNLLNPSRINTNQSEEKSFDFRPAIGIEFKRKTNNKFKSFTIGFPFSYNWSKDKGKITLADINGDGLDDLVYQTSNGLKFRPHQYDFSAHTFGEEMNINDIGNFYNGNSKTTTRFLPFDIAFGKKWKKYVSWKKLLTKSYTDVYFVDGNGDGLADIVKDNKVYFNTLNSNGEPTYQTSSSTTPNMVITAAAVETPPIDTEGDDDDAFLIKNTDYDLVKVWVAPQQVGLFAIEDNFSFIPSSPGEKVVYSIETEYITGEIARLYLKEFNTAANESIYIDSYNTYNPDLGFSALSNNRFIPGQKFYFRVHKNTPGTNPIVNFDPKVKTDFGFYSTGTVDAIDQNNINVFDTKYSDNFILSSKDDFELPSTGVVSIEWPDFNASELSDDVTFKIIKVSEIGNTSTEQVVYQKFCPQNATTTVAENTNALAFNISNLQYSTLGEEEEIYFYATVTSDSNVRWKDIEWKLKLTYTPDANAIAQEEEFNTVSRYVIADYSIYKPTYIRNKKIQIRTQDVPNQSLQYWFKIKSDIITGYNQLTSIDNGQFDVVFKKNGHYFAKRQVQIINGTINVSNNNDPINFYFGNVHLNEQDKISIEVYAKSNEDLKVYKKYSFSVLGPPPTAQVEYGAHVLCGYTSSPNNIIFANNYPDVFVKDYNENLGPLYNGWGQFFYNDTIAANISNTLPSDGYGQLINSDIIDDPSLQYSEDLISQLGCGSATNLDDCMNNQIYDNLGLPGEGVDFSDGNTDALEDSFYSENGDYEGTFDMPEICFLPARPYRTFESNNYIEKWMGLFNNNFSSATQGQVGNFDESMFADTPTEPDENVLFPPQQLDLYTGMYSITKFHKSLASSKTYGAGPFNLSKSNTTNGNKYSTTKQDFFDLNGDRYPDIFTDNSLNYTNMTGGHKSNEGNLGFGPIISNSSDLLGTTLSTNSLNAGDTESLSCPGIITGVISILLGKPISLNRTGFGKPSASMGINANLSGSNYGMNFWQDVNGDGLADRVNVTDGQFKVQFNKGYLNSGVSNEVYSGLSPNTTTPGPGVNFGFSPASLQTVYDQVSGLNGTGFDLNLSINFGLSFSGNNADKMLQDINSDGLVDIINSNGGPSSVMINNGHTFNTTTMPLSASGLNFKNDTFSSAFGVNGEASIYFRIYRILAWVIKVGITFGGGYNLSISESNKSLKDFDGDGYLDFVEKISDGINYYPSNIKRTNMLKIVKNPLGGSFTMDYTPQKLTYENPNSNWAMTSLIVNDGRDIANDGVDSYSTTFAYENGKYDRRERTFYGYEKVKVIDNTSNGVYRVSVSKFHNENYFLAGLIKESYLTKDVNETQIHSKSTNTYHIKKTNDDGTIDVNSNEPFTYDVGGTEGRRQAAVLLMKTTSELYEFGTTPILTETNFEYDTYGRIEKYDNIGNIALSQDNYSSIITYHTLNNNILSVPKKITVNQAGVAVRIREITSVNANTGDVLEIKTKLNATENAVTKMTYDQYGNILTIIYPPNSSSQSMKYTYAYDITLNKYVVSITDSFNYVSSATYDPKFDTLLTSTDLSGNTMTYAYDNVGRVVKIIAPKESGNPTPYTIKFEYFNKYSQLTPYGYQSCVTTGNFIPFAVTKHYDVEHPDNPIETVTFVDGLARPIQVKKDVEINTVADASLTPTYVEHMSVSGMVTYDIYGRAVKQLHPKKEIKACTTNFIVNQVSDPVDSYFSTIEYDVLDRTVKTISPAPASNVSQMQYSLANNHLGILSIKTKSIVDQNTTAQVITESFSDIQGKTTSTVNIGGPGGNILTKFVYNAIGELLSYEDAEGLTTKYRYDNAGRKIEVVHPDSGMSTYKYDPASNLINSQTANLIANGESIVYKYDYNRLKHVVFPAVSGSQNISDVDYEYGPVGAPGINNQRGRLISQRDATGTQEFEYGNMGEMVYNKRTIVAPNLPTRVFETRFDYDSWNRVQRMTYPDGEVLNYAYDKGGNLSKMTGEYNSQPYDYISRIDYDYFEQRTYIKYGNNTETKYSYTNDLRRLNNLQVKAASSQLLFNNTYTYDKVGNILGINNTAPFNTINGLGGTYNNNYTYDKLNRLATASGDFKGQNKTTIVNKSNYTLKMEYNNTHGILLKEQVHSVNNYPTYDTTHENEYHYEPNSHRIKSVFNADTNEEDTFEYDANGNTTIHVKNDGLVRQMLWDESNRLRVVSDDGDLKHYIYDAAGERILKANLNVEQVYQNGQLVDGNTALSNYTTYASAYLVIDAAQQYSKHYYAGSQRIVSKIGEQNIEIFNEQALKQVAPIPDPKMGTDAIKQLQIADLQNLLQKAKLGKATFKEYKVEEPLTQEEADEFEKENISEDNSTNRAAILTGLYFFHQDHLGTSTFLTDANGNPYQFFLNLPFGETMYEQNSLTENYYNPYKFSGKELDAETGLYYFGARYYNPRIATWYSVDPLAEKFPNFNPYNYCMQNPINLIDPDGKAVKEPPYSIILRYMMSKKDQSIMYGAMANAKKYTDNAFRVYAHAAHSYIQGYDKGDNVVVLDTATKFQNYMKNNSEKEEWGSFMNSKNGTCIFYACNSGDKNGIVQKISNDSKGKIFVAPTEYVNIASDGGVGVYTPKEVNGKKFSVKGGWNIYVGGKIVDTRPWDWQPVEIDPKTYKDLKQPPREKSTWQKFKEFFD